MGSIVGLVKANSLEGLRAQVSQVTDLIGFKPEGTVKTVLVKPNMCYYWDATTGYTTDPRLVSAIIDYV